MASARSIARHYAPRPDDVSYCAMPLFHVHGLVASTLAPLRRRRDGRRAAARRARAGSGRSSASTASRGTRRARRSTRCCSTARPTSVPDGARLRFVRSCSSALRPELADRLEEYLGVPMLEAYGMTEASHEMAANPLPPARRVLGSVGVPTGAEIRIVDEAGATLPPGQPGEVVIRGPGVMAGYLANAGGERRGFFGELVPDRRPGRARRRLPAARRAPQGDHHPRRREHLARSRSRRCCSATRPSPRRSSSASRTTEVRRGRRRGGRAPTPASRRGRAASRTAASGWPRSRCPSVVHVVEAIPRTPTGKVQRPRMAAHFGEA